MFKLKLKDMKKEFVDVKSDELVVNIIGRCNSGKSTLQLIIGDALRKHGFNVEINSPDFKNEGDIRFSHLINEEDRIKVVVIKNNKVSINEVFATTKI